MSCRNLILVLTSHHWSRTGERGGGWPLHSVSWLQIVTSKFQWARLPCPIACVCCWLCFQFRIFVSFVERHSLPCLLN